MLDGLPVAAGGRCVWDGGTRLPERHAGRRCSGPGGVAWSGHVTARTAANTAALRAKESRCQRLIEWADDCSLVDRCGLMATGQSRRQEVQSHANVVARPLTACSKVTPCLRPQYLQRVGHR